MKWAMSGGIGWAARLPTVRLQCSRRTRPLHFHGYAIRTKTNRLPEGLPITIIDEHVDADARRTRPGIAPEPMQRGARDTPATVRWLDEQLPEIDVLRLTAEKSISNNAGSELEDHRLIIGTQPIRHSLFKLRDGHGITVTLVADELGIQQREHRRILRQGKTESRRRVQDAAAQR